jgi:hypothetical protein
MNSQTRQVVVIDFPRWSCNHPGMETVFVEVLRFLVAWVPTWLGFTGWVFAGILVIHGSSGEMNEKGTVVILTRELPGCLLIALLIGAVFTGMAWATSNPG